MTRASQRKIGLWRVLQLRGPSTALALSGTMDRPVASIHKDLCDLRHLGAVESGSGDTSKRNQLWSVPENASLDPTGESFISEVGEN